MKHTSALLLLGAFACTPVISSAAPEAISVSKCWIRTLPENLPAGAYFEMKNSTNQSIDLVGAHTEAFGEAMLHETRDEKGTSTMMMVKKVTIPAHGSASFSPGHYHVMLENAVKPLKVGTTIMMTLQFNNGQSTDVECKVKGPDAMSW